MKQLDRLLYIQGGECFFCKRPLPKAEASVEHLVASANGGNNAEENCVACCKTLNALLGNKSLKEKLEVFLRQKGTFRCPAETVKSRAPTVTQSQSQPAPPKPTASAKPGPAKASPPLVVVGGSPSAPAPVADVRIAAGRTVTCPTCKRTVSAEVGQLDYVCQGCGGAFRY